MRLILNNLNIVYSQMTAKKDRKNNSAYFENTKEVKDEKTEMLSVSKFNIKKVKRVEGDKFDSRCKSWRLIVRNLPFKVGISNFRCSS